ncbi:MAG: phosphatase PAP2 family protein [Polyangiaceae bacterium]
MKRLVSSLIALAFVLAAAPDAQAEDKHWQEPTVKWNEDWPRFRLLEVGSVVALTAGSIVFSSISSPTQANWKGPILFDTAARKFFRGDSVKTEQTAADVSDYLYKGSVLFPYIVDNYIVALGVHQSADVALEMTLMDMQSLGFAGVLSLGAERAVGRQRPYATECDPARPPGQQFVRANVCNPPVDNQSFYSGHAAATFSIAGLTCVHHQHFPLYGGGLPDTMACVGMLGLATTTSVLRLVADRHYASDVLTGTAVGLFSGYVLPSLLHYGFGKTRSKPLLKTTYGNVAPIPLVYNGGAGLGVTGIF